jgi:ubiquinone biosynthesis monooxygenase Coq7
MGEQAAMACTAAVEDVIDRHYAGQVARLEGEDELKACIEEFRAEEVAHRDTAFAAGAESAPLYPLLSAAIKTGCRLAIRLSERV